MAWGIAGELASTGPMGSSKRTSTQRDIPKGHHAEPSMTGDSKSHHDQEPRTTLTGKPLTRPQHDNFTSIMFAEGGGFAGSNSAGANLLPPGYTDSSLVNIPIKMSDIRRKEPSDAVSDPAIQLESKKPGKLSRLKGFVKHGGTKQDEEIVVVQMSRGDYLKYWAKGEDGKFLENVVEPEEGRAEWVRLRQVEMENRKKQA